MKFVFMTDLHGRANNPISRKDFFPDTILKKCEWVVNYANQMDAVILCGGDWLQRPDTSPNFIASLAKILMKARRGVYSVLGNHDIYSYNIDSFTRTPLYLLFACGIIKLLTNKPTVFAGEDGKYIEVTGVSSHPMLDKNHETKDYVLKGREMRDDTFRIHVVHGFLANKKWPDQVPHTLIDDTTEENCADVILTGHEHSGYNVIEKETSVSGNTHFITYCNPGSLARVTAGVGDMRDDVRIALIDNNAVCKVSLISVPCKKAEDVLDREKLVEEKKQSHSIEAFAVKLANIQNADAEDTVRYSSAIEMLTEYVKKIRENGEAAEWVTDEIVKLATEVLTQSEEQMAESRKRRRSE